MLARGRGPSLLAAIVVAACTSPRSEGGPVLPTPTARARPEAAPSAHGAPPAGAAEAARRPGDIPEEARGDEDRSTAPADDTSADREAAVGGGDSAGSASCVAERERISAQVAASRNCEQDEDCVEIHVHCFAPCRAAVRADARISILAASTAYFDACGVGGCGKPKCAELGTPVCRAGRCTL
jgi:hypothetical protein